ncbi:MAG: iron ABC transporter permease, partial [Fimbriimonadaceae bacterium]|nr:iron ABC transporter permease [Fimbriimonadaceae bacterium]
MTRRPWWIFLGLGLAAAFLLHLIFGGTSTLSPFDLWRELTSGPGGDSAANVIVWQIRLPRVVSALLIGTLLGAVGAVFQAYFRNPLADPYVVGVASGASLGGAFVLLVGLGAALAGLAVPVGGFFGGMGALALVLALGRGPGGATVDRLILAGVVVGAMLSALVSVLLILAGQDANQVLRWLLGSVTPASWIKASALAVVLAVILPLLSSQARVLNGLSISEQASRTAGVDLDRVRWIVLGGGTLATAAAVVMAG